jgi:hydroxymethylbilane synthase
LQTRLVASLLNVDVEPVVVQTSGDRRADVPIWELGRQGVFVKEVQAALLDGRADIAVHSAKDLPSHTEHGLVIGAVPEREDARDALVGSALDVLPVGALVATGSVRRRAQLAYRRPDLTFTGLRGNIDTRLAKASQFHAIVVAAAALRRLGRSEAIAELLDPRWMVPQVAQGALAVECREDDDATRALLAAIDDPVARPAVEAERAWLAAVGSGCDLPVGAHAVVHDGVIHLTAMLASTDGRIVLRADDSDVDPHALGARLANHLLREAGGDDLLAVTRLPDRNAPDHTDAEPRV